MITRDQAWEKLNDWVKNQNLIKHCLAVEMAMRAYFDYFKTHLETPSAVDTLLPQQIEDPLLIEGKNQERWATAGLIHDADWEAYPDEHPKRIVQWLTDQGVDEEVTNAVASHGFNLGVEAKSLMAKTLRAVDELTGLIVAVALVKDKQLANVTVESVLNKWKKTDFAKGVNREDIKRGAAEINVPLEQHIAIVLQAMQSQAAVLGLS